MWGCVGKVAQLEAAAAEHADLAKAREESALTWQMRHDELALEKESQERDMDELSADLEGRDRQLAELTRQLATLSADCLLYTSDAADDTPC
eukprot:4444308-Pyramimonas_sp.AAC.1